MITEPEFHALPIEVQRLLLDTLLPRDTRRPATDGDDLPATAEMSDDDGGDEMPELSPQEAKKLITGVVDKTLRVLRSIAEHPGPTFALADIIQQTGFKTENDLRGVWAGITRRSRKIAGDPELTLIWWAQKDDGWHGEISQMAHRSLRKAFRLPDTA